VRPCTLYRFFDIEGRLLYVGISVSPLMRFMQHRGAKEWWFDAERIHLDHFDNAREAKTAESHAIKTERPLYNTAEQVVSGPWPWDFEVIIRAEPALRPMAEKASRPGFSTDCPWQDAIHVEVDAWRDLVYRKLGTRRHFPTDPSRHGIEGLFTMTEFIELCEERAAERSERASIERVLGDPAVAGWFWRYIEAMCAAPCDHRHAASDWDDQRERWAQEMQEAQGEEW
jgi:hypothetical protein